MGIGEALGDPSDTEPTTGVLATQDLTLRAEREGFEPSVPFLDGTHDFQSCPFGQLGHLSV